MSYCRWSSDDFWCDIYCYESICGGWMVHVAANRVVGEIPKTLHLLKPETIEEFLQAHRAQMDFLDTAERHPIGLPHDGETFVEPSALEAMKRLSYLKGLGYNVPDYAIDELQEEASNETTPNHEAKPERARHSRNRCGRL